MWGRTHPGVAGNGETCHFAPDSAAHERSPVTFRPPTGSLSRVQAVSLGVLPLRLRWLVVPLFAAVLLGSAGCEKRPPLSVSVRVAREALEARTQAADAAAREAAPRDSAGALVDSLAPAPDSIAAWVAEFYRARADEPVWFDDHGATPRAGAALAALASLPEHGLDPAAYAPESTLVAAGRAPLRDRVDVDSLPALGVHDVALTLACARAAMAVACGRTDVAGLDPEWNFEARRAEAWARLQRELPAGFDAATLQGFAPADSAYGRLQRALAQLQRQAPAGAAPDARVRTLAMNLERRRWMSGARSGERLEVNVPDFRLTWTDGADSVRTFRVVVGDTAHQTPIFSDAVAWLDVHPGWRLGRRIVAEEIAPALRRNPAYLARHDMEVVRTDRKGLPVVAPEEVPWDSVYGNGRFPYLVRQRPGPKNPLGKVKFACPNEYDVYLHDTNARGLFSRDVRALSHGCIRVARPETLAALLLRPTKWAPTDSLRRLFADTLQRRVNLPEPVPVDFFYWTAWVDDQGELQTRRDLYGLDHRMASHLRERPREKFVLNPEVDWRAPRRAKAAKKPAAAPPTAPEGP